MAIAILVAFACFHTVRVAFLAREYGWSAIFAAFGIFIITACLYAWDLYPILF